jgi:hypothetical protein
MKTIVLLFTLLLTACSSVPMSTMMHFSDAKPDDFFMVDPKGIIVKVTINSSAHFNPSSSVNLSATIEYENGLRNFSFPLEQVSVAKQAAESSFFSEQPELALYFLKLSDEAIRNLNIIKKESESGVQKKVGLSAGVNFNKDKNEIDENTVLSIALKLTDKASFITLIDNWEVSSLL